MSNGITIEVRSSDFRGLRGLTLVAAIFDEICHFRSDESSNPDEEIIAAVRPALMTTKGQLFTIGSPYAKRGFAYTTCERYFGAEGDPRIIVARGSTRDFNSSIPEEEINREIARDPASAASEYLGLWRDDLAAYVSREAVMACISPSTLERAWVRGSVYSMFVDPSGGSSDSMTCAVAHQEKGVAILDAIREVRPPFSPEAVVEDFIELAKAYHCHTVTGDRYGGVFSQEPFNKRGIKYLLSEKAKSDIYHALLPSLNSRKVDLLDNSRLITQLCSLERHVGRGTGRDVIDHPRGMHDDVANAVAGALVLAAGKVRQPMKIDDSLLAWAAIPSGADNSRLGPYGVRL